VQYLQVQHRTPKPSHLVAEGGWAKHKDKFLKDIGVSTQTTKAAGTRASTDKQRSSIRGNFSFSRAVFWRGIASPVTACILGYADSTEIYSDRVKT